MNKAIGRASLFIACCVATGALLISPALAQVNGPGPSSSNLFDTVINLPGDENIIAAAYEIGGVPGQTTQLNVSEGGVLSSCFFARFGSEVNISGGEVGDFVAFSGSEVNISGGNVQGNFIAGGVVSISGGSVGDQFGIDTDSVVNISGGTLGQIMFYGGGEVNISGGTLTVDLEPASGSVVNISGGTLEGTLTAGDGSETNISGGTLERRLFANSGSEVNISGGTLEQNLSAGPQSRVNIEGGTLRDGFAAGFGTIVNLSGGQILGSVLVDELCTVNVSGSAFSIDGTPLSNLVPGQTRFITERGTLSGVLADGAPFTFGPGAIDPSASLMLIVVDPLLLGDCNQDGIVNFQDISPFIAILSSQSFLDQADCNQDGVVNFLDIQPLIQLLANN